MSRTIADTNFEYVVYHPRTKRFLTWSGRTMYNLTSLSDALRRQSFHTRTRANDFIQMATKRHEGANMYIYDPKMDRLIRTYLKDEKFRVLKVKQVVTAKV